MEGMRLKDYLDRLTPEDREDVLSNMEAEEQELREFLTRFAEYDLELIATELNDVFAMPSDGMDVTDFIVTLYKCQKADFLYESVEEVIEAIETIADEMDL